MLLSQKKVLHSTSLNDEKIHEDAISDDLTKCFFYSWRLNVHSCAQTILLSLRKAMECLQWDDIVNVLVCSLDTPSCYEWNSFLWWFTLSMHLFTTVKNTNSGFFYYVVHLWKRKLYYNLFFMLFSLNSGAYEKSN